MSNLDTKNKLDTRYIIYLDLIKDIKNKVMDFNLSDVETNDFLSDYTITKSFYLIKII